ncbi:MAG: Stk1 family PASTA domain-containing Ser/Thr kinase [Eubacterium sp.]|jgi:serine/threonine-protein kinase|nr:Stk1 family PASTA domain-containing Ser/Thr kinase [Eubacterium sp.]
MDNNIGKRLDGRYEILELIGVGGMADIYKAHDIVDNRTVAVKVLKTELAGSDDFLRRFRNESKAIALLSHANIVKIFDVGFSEYIQFIVMEYIDGINLTEYIQSQGMLKWKDALHFTVQVLKALQHAHDRGIVHRDIKSQNIMLLSDGTIKVMDFGIAHFNRETNKTMSEKAIGSVHYISPEQAKGEITDEKSDIYSVGVMLYEMLTGKKPFDGENPVSIALMHMQSKPKKPTEINPELPVGLEEITIKAMQKKPAARYQTAGEMINDIEEFKKNPSIVFEYKYFSSDGPQKYFDEAGDLRTVSNPRKVRVVDKMIKKNLIPDDLEQSHEGYDEMEEEEVAERRSPFLSILFAVASVFVIMTAVLIYKIVSDSIGGGASAEHTMPNLVGFSYDEVVAKYPYLNFNPSQEYSPEPKDYIIRQDTPVGTIVKERQTIDIYVSNGPRLIDLDNYENRHVDEARNMLEKQGFKVTIKYEESETVNTDYVIRTEPEARTLLQEGENVTIFIGIKKDGQPTTVPDMLGQTREKAEENAKAFKLLLTVVEEPSVEEKGTVLRQSIDAGTSVPENSKVEIIVSSGELPTKKGRISFSLNSANTDGNYKVEYYIDGVLQEEMTETRNIELNRRLEWEFEDMGVKNYAIYLTSESNGNTAKLCEYEFDFTVDGENAERTELYMNDRIFTELREGISADAEDDFLEYTTAFSDSNQNPEVDPNDEMTPALTTAATPALTPPAFEFPEEEEEDPLFNDTYNDIFGG